MAGQKLAVHDPDDGDIAKGEAPPDLRQMDSEMLKKRLEAIKEKMQQDKNAQIELQLVATVLQLVDDDGYLKEALKNVLSDEGLLERINKKGGTVPNEGHFGDVKVAIKKHFANIDPSQYTDAMGKAIREVLKLPDAPPKNAILSAFFEGIRPHLKNTLDDSGITPASTGLFPEEQKYFNPGDNKTPDQAFWEERDQMEMEDAYVPDEQKPGFASALREMPTVKSILDPSLQEAQTRQGTAQWKDGGALHDEGNIDKVNDLSAPKKWMAPKRLNSRTFRNKVQRVDRLMRVVVEPQLLIRAKKPRIKLHATAAQSIDAPWGYRAHANDEEVNISYNEATETISHEVGHAVERHLPVSAWHDVHMLLSGRHQAAGGGGLKAGDTPIFTTWSEGRFGGKYVTGKYTSRTYSFGNIAEVVAMATQYFSDPGMAAQLIDGDPQHAAIVLRALQPAEYTSIGALRQYDKYLPHKKKPPLPPKLSPQKRKLLLERGRQRMEKHKEQQK
jgi:hypothetical protein